MSLLIPVMVVVSSGLLCLLPCPPLQTAGAVLLATLAPGWCLWRLADASWSRRRWDFRLALAVVGSCAVTPLALYWGTYGREFSAPLLAGELTCVCLLLLALGTWRRGREERAEEPAADSRRRQLALAGMALLFAALILVPLSTSGRHTQGWVSLSPCSADWSYHRAVTWAVLDTGVPPRDPLLCYQGMTYYYGQYLQAASLVRLSGGGLGVEGALALLSVLLALATPLLLYHLLRSSRATAPAALAATGVAVFVGGLDLLGLGGELLLHQRLAVHLAVWARQPRVVTPFGNLHWAQHHHAAALLVLALVWYLSTSGQTSLARRALITGVLLAGTVVTSAYLGLVVLLGLGLLYAGMVVQPGRSRGARGRLTLAGVGVLALGLLLSSGLLREMSQMVRNQKTRLVISLPHNQELAAALFRGHPRGGAAAPETETGAEPAAEASPGPESARQRLVAVLAGLLGLPVQFGLVGLLGVGGLLRRGGWRSLPLPVLALLVSAAGCCLLVRNFDLQIRSAATLWLLLGTGVALYLGTPPTRRWGPGWVLVGLGGLLGLAALAWEVTAMARPVYLDANDVAVMTWVREHTPPRAVVQAFPGTTPAFAARPQGRFFAMTCYPEFTGRCALMGGSDTMRAHEQPEVLAQWTARLAAAFLAPDSAQARERFRQAGVDYVLWTSGDTRAAWAAAESRLLDPRYFELANRSGASFVVRVR